MADGKPTKFDPRAYVALDHGMPENPKVVGLDDAAFRLYIEAICYCSRQQSDGAIPPAALRRLGSTESADALLTAGLLEKQDHDWAVHDYLLHQRSAEEISQIREHKADSGVRGAHARWHIARRRFDAKCLLCNPDAPGEVDDA